MRSVPHIGVSAAIALAPLLLIPVEIDDGGGRFATDGEGLGQQTVSNVEVLFMTYVGGTSEQVGTGVVLDSEGNLIVSGTTFSEDFPVVNAEQPQLAGGSDIFVAKIDPVTGDYLFATFIGGAGSDAGAGLALDSEDNIYVCGSTVSEDFPTLNPLQSEYTGSRDAVYFRLSSDGQLEYSTYLGGSGSDHCRSIAVSEGGEVVMGGYTSSEDLPLAAPVQDALEGDDDAFVAMLNAAGDQLVYSTYVGGSDRDRIRQVDVDETGSVVISGETRSADFPIANALQSAPGGGQDGFVARLSPSGDHFLYSTYLGGSANDFAFGIALDASGNAYVAGTTLSDDFPTENAFQSDFGGGTVDGFLTKIDPDGQVLFSTYLGGEGDDALRAVDVDEAGGAVVAGYTEGLDVPMSAKRSESTVIDDPATVVTFTASGEPVIQIRFGGEIYTEWFTVKVRGDVAGVVGDRTAGSPSVSTDGSQPSSTSSYDMLAGVITLPPASDSPVLLVDKVPSKEKVILGESFSWSLSVENIGAQTAESVVVTDNPSEDLMVAGRKDKPFDIPVGNLAPGETWTVVLKSRSDDVGDGDENIIIATADNAARVSKRASVDVEFSDLQLQLIHAQFASGSQKAALGVVDVYLDGQLVADDLEEGRAVPVGPIQLGDVDPDLDVVPSTDVDNSEPLFSIPVDFLIRSDGDTTLSHGAAVILFEVGDDSLGMVVNRELKVESSGSDIIDFSVANASSEAIDVWVRPEGNGPQHVFDDLAPGVASQYASLDAGVTTVTMKSADGNGELLAAEFDLSDLGGSALMLAFTVSEGGSGMRIVSPDGDVREGRVVTSGESAVEFPDLFAVRGVFPNPVHRNATILFDLPETGIVSVAIFDVQGRSVMRSEAKQVAAGAGRVVTLAVDRLPSGTYFYRLMAQSGADRWVTSGDIVVVR